MSKSIAFIGSSFLAGEGHELLDSERLKRTSDDGQYILEDHWEPHNFASESSKGLNFVQEISKQHPNFKIYNVSSNGGGVDTLADRVTYTEEKYNPDVYCIENFNNLRLSWFVDERYLTNYEDFYPLQIFENGKLLNPDKTFNKIPQLDDAWATLKRNDREIMWKNKLYGKVPSKDTQQISRFLTTYDHKARSKQVVSTLKLVHGYLTNKNKTVKFFQWDKPEGDNNTDHLFFNQFPENDIEFLKNNLINHTYFLKWMKQLTPDHNKYMRDETHLNYDGFKKFAMYFDSLF